MANICPQQSSGAFLKLDDLSSQFDDSTTTFNLTVGSEAYYPDNPYTLMVSLGGVIQEPVTSFTINDDQIVFSAAPSAGASFFIVVLATTNVAPLKTLTIGSRAGAQVLDLHGRKLAVSDRSGIKHTISLNLS